MNAIAKRRIVASAQSRIVTHLSGERAEVTRKQTSDRAGEIEVACLELGNALGTLKISKLKVRFLPRSPTVLFSVAIRKNQRFRNQTLVPQLFPRRRLRPALIIESADGIVQILVRSDSALD
jgi:hypothetical protein